MISYVFGRAKIACFDCIEIQGVPHCTMNCGPSVPLCPTCKQPTGFEHDHKTDLSGLDDGPPLPGHAPRKKAAPKSAEEMRDIRARAWQTRREKYGQYGHR